MQLPTIPDIHQVTSLRHSLHRYPELSGQEVATAEQIVNFLTHYSPDRIYTGLGGTGVAAVYYGQTTNGPTVLFRAELDALPIAETNSLAHTSVNKGVGHTCGHDGHMAILGGLATLLHQQKPASGKVALLFQPAEETGAGAWSVLQDKRFAEISPDYVFALHNLPGVPLHQVVVRQQVFAAASTGMIIELQGKPSHAAEPENGVNPGAAMAELILAFQDIIQRKEQFKDLTLLTVIHARLGEVAFGTNPGFATVMATLRSFLPTDFHLLKKLCVAVSKEVAERHGLQHNIRFVEEFPATVNHTLAVDLVRLAAQKLQLEVTEAVNPFRWSEDFGHFTHLYKGALFGLGAGTEQAQLHHSDYDFPDALISTGSRLFHAIAHEILNR